MNAKRRPLQTTESILVFGNFSISPQFGLKGKYNPQGITEENKDITYNGYLDTSNRGERKGRTYKKKNTNYPKNLLSIKSEEGLHPTQKPVALFEYLIKTYSNEGDLVLDNCAGSFTTAIASENLKRNWICIEKEPKYVEIARERIKNMPIKLF